MYHTQRRAAPVSLSFWSGPNLTSLSVDRKCSLGGETRCGPPRTPVSSPPTPGARSSVCARQEAAVVQTDKTDATTHAGVSASLHAPGERRAHSCLDSRASTRCWCHSGGGVPLCSHRGAAGVQPRIKIQKGQSSQTSALEFPLGRLLSEGAVMAPGCTEPPTEP